MSMHLASHSQQGDDIETLESFQVTDEKVKSH